MYQKTYTLSSDAFAVKRNHDDADNVYTLIYKWVPAGHSSVHSAVLSAAAGVTELKIFSEKTKKVKSFIYLGSGVYGEDWKKSIGQYLKKKIISPKTVYSFSHEDMVNKRVYYLSFVLGKN